MKTEQKMKTLIDSNRELYFKNKKLIQEKHKRSEDSFFPTRSFDTSSTASLPTTFKVTATSARTSSKSSQTCQNDEIPYSVTEALPPIFASQLCYLTKPIRHLSSSLPNLSTMNWVKFTEEDRIRDEAEEALCDQFDRRIIAFYEDARETAKAIRQVYEGSQIPNLFGETDWLRFRLNLQAPCLNELIDEFLDWFEKYILLIRSK